MLHQAILSNASFHVENSENQLLFVPFSKTLRWQFILDLNKIYQFFFDILKDKRKIFNISCGILLFIYLKKMFLARQNL